jgi:hypothetical protein
MRTSRSVTGGLAAAAALAAVLLAGCAGGDGDDEAASAPPPTAPVTPPPAPPATGPVEPPSTIPVTPPLRPPPTIRSGELTISGDIVAGVEPGCKLLDTGTALYLLFGPEVDDLRTGGTATVRGEVRADMASTCQQGTPFEIIEVIE